MKPSLLKRQRDRRRLKRADLVEESADTPRRQIKGTVISPMHAEGVKSPIGDPLGDHGMGRCYSKVTSKVAGVSIGNL